MVTMPSKRKHNPAYSATKTTVKSHTRTVYKRKPKSKFHISNFVKKQTCKSKRARGVGEEAVREIGKKVINKVIPIPNILSISGVAQTLTDWIKKKPAPYVKPISNEYAKSVDAERLKAYGKRLDADRQRRQAKCYWPYIYRGPNWKKGQPCQDVRYSADAHKYVF